MTTTAPPPTMGSEDEPRRNHANFEGSDSGPVRGQVVTSGKQPKDAPRTWKDRGLASCTPQRWQWMIIGAVVLLAVLGCGDLPMIKSTLDHALRLSETLSWLVATAITVGAAASMYRAGWAKKHWDCTGEMPAGHIWLFIGVWLVLGASLFVMRWNAADFVKTSTTGFEDGAAGSASVNSAQEHWVAIVMLAVYSVTAALAYIEGYTLTNDAAKQLRQNTAQLEAAVPALATGEGKFSQLVANAGIHQVQLAALPAEREEAKRHYAALVGETREYSRTYIATLLGSPPATGGVRTPPRGDLG